MYARFAPATSLPQAASDLPLRTRGKAAYVCGVWMTRKLCFSELCTRGPIPFVRPPAALSWKPRQSRRDLQMRLHMAEPPIIEVLHQDCGSQPTSTPPTRRRQSTRWGVDYCSGSPAQQWPTLQYPLFSWSAMDLTSWRQGFPRGASALFLVTVSSSTLLAICMVCPVLAFVGLSRHGVSRANVETHAARHTPVYRFKGVECTHEPQKEAQDHMAQRENIMEATPAWLHLEWRQHWAAKRVRRPVKTVAVASGRLAAQQESHHGKRAAELEVTLSKTGTLVTNEAVSGGVGCGKTCRCPP